MEGHAALLLVRSLAVHLLLHGLVRFSALQMWGEVRLSCPEQLPQSL
jgi:hypothetical protein